MNGIVFGKEIRNLRLKRGINSKELSKMINRGDAYISQIENGKIKNPDYETSYNLLKTLGIENTRIEEILKKHNIKTMEQQEAELIKALHIHDLFGQRVYYESDIESTDDFIYWYSNTTNQLKQANDRIYQRFNVFIDKDFSTAQKVITSMDTLTGNMNDFYFFCMIISNDYSKICTSKRDAFIVSIKNLITQEASDCDHSAAQL
jgi:transcriptional regulator with XRE-family HTH domain